MPLPVTTKEEVLLVANRNDATRGKFTFLTTAQNHLDAIEQYPDEPLLHLQFMDVVARHGDENKFAAIRPCLDAFEKLAASNKPLLPVADFSLNHLKMIFAVAHYCLSCGYDDHAVQLMELFNNLLDRKLEANAPGLRSEVIELASRIDNIAIKSPQEAWEHARRARTDLPNEPIFMLQEFAYHLGFVSDPTHKNAVCKMYRPSLNKLTASQQMKDKLAYPIERFTPEHAAFFPLLAAACEKYDEPGMADSLYRLGKLPIPAEERGKIVAFRPKTKPPASEAPPGLT